MAENPGKPGPDRPTAPGWTGATGTPTRLLLLRHGQTELSVQRRYSGCGNPELTDTGGARPMRRRASWRSAAAFRR